MARVVAIDSAGTSWSDARRASWSLRRAAARTAMADLDSSRPWLSVPKSCPLWSTTACYGFTVGASRLRFHGPQNPPVVVVGEGRPRPCAGNPPQLVHL